MTYHLDFDSQSRRLIQHLSPIRKKKIKAALRSIADEPYAGKTLQDELQGLHSYRVGTLRIIYAIDHKPKIVHVVAIGPRRTIYEDVQKAAKKKSSGKENS